MINFTEEFRFLLVIYLLENVLHEVSSQFNTSYPITVDQIIRRCPVLH